jgi:diketogulonate reductase-like aldo/keto reductase
LRSARHLLFHGIPKVGTLCQVAYIPALNSGFYAPEDKVVDALEEVAQEVGKAVPQVALNWLLQRPSVSTVIVGARNEEQLRQNLAAAGWNLSSAQIAKLDAASNVTPVYPYWHQRQFEERNPAAIPLSENAVPQSVGESACFA